MFVHSAALMLTSRCNLACSYCYELVKPIRSMSVETARQAIDWLLSPSVSRPEEPVEVVLFGGEPLLEFRLILDLVPYAHAAAESAGKWVDFTMTTNGTLFGEKVHRFWTENGLRVLLSCDGTQEAHDTHRLTPDGRGSYAALERNMSYLADASKSKEVRMTVTPETVGLLTDSIASLRNCGFHSLAAYHAEEAAWSEHDLARLQEEVYRVAERWCADLEAGEVYSVNPLDRCIRLILRPSDRSRDALCGAGRGYVAINTDGKLFPCHHFASANQFDGAFPIGDIRDGFDARARITFLRATQSNLLGCDIDCAECELSGRCRGGCMAVNYDVSGNIFLRPPTARFHELIWMEVAQSVVDYFRRNRCERFEELFPASKAEPEGRLDLPSCTAP